MSKSENIRSTAMLAVYVIRNGGRIRLGAMSVKELSEILAVLKRSAA